MQNKAKQSEILFIWDCENSNPNGDMLNSNAPRYDEISRKALVSDVRVKRTIRDDIIARKSSNPKYDIFVKEEKSEKGGIVDAKERARNIMYEKPKETDSLEWIKKKCIDVRAFGGVIPIEGKKDKAAKSKKGAGEGETEEDGGKKESSYNLTGAIQFKMTKSLNECEITFIKGTGGFASKAGAENKTFREEYTLPYAVFATYGVCNAYAAEKTDLTEGDFSEIIDSLWSGTKNLITRSKMGQFPRFLLLITYKEKGCFIGELDNLIKIITDKAASSEIRGLSDYELDFSEIGESAKKYSSVIEKIEYTADSRFKNRIKNIPTEWKEIEPGLC